jgi:hypothetical protein
MSNINQLTSYTILKSVKKASVNLLIPSNVLSNSHYADRPVHR